MCLSGDLGCEKIELGPSSTPLKTIICLPSAYKKAAAREDCSARKTLTAACHPMFVVFQQRVVTIVVILQSLNDWQCDDPQKVYCAHAFA